MSRDLKVVSAFPVGLIFLGVTILLSLRFARRNAAEPAPATLEVELESEVLDET